MAKDYYLILGVGSDATQDEIRSAYRRQAKKCHPDHTGEGCEPFLAVREAYEVLGDAGRRRAYDREWARSQQSAQPASWEARPQRPRWRDCPVEPLVPTQRTSGRPDTFWESPLSSLIEELFYRSRSDQDIPIRPGTSRGVGDIHIEVRLTGLQALRGGHVRVGIPMQVGCPACRGRGAVGLFECPYCFGSGTAVSEHPVEIAFPGGLVDGSQGSVTVERPGMRDVSLVLHFRVQEW